MQLDAYDEFPQVKFSPQNVFSGQPRSKRISIHLNLKVTVLPALNQRNNGGMQQKNCA